MITSTNRVASFSVQPAAATGGTTLTATIRLLEPVRRASDGIVTLTSSSASVPVPSTITIPIGVSSTVFDIVTSVVATDSAVTVTATTSANSQSASLTLLAGNSALAQLVLDGDSVDGGTSLNATLVLGAPAPAGGALVSLSSSNTRLATVPVVVLVPEGATSLVVTVTTYPVAVNEEVTVRATYGATKSDKAFINACTSLSTLVPPPASTTLDTTWLDDTLPVGATATGDGVIDSTQFASGSSAVHLSGAAPGVRTYAFTDASPLAITPNDRLVFHVLVNPCNPPRQILVGWKTSTAEYRASWGESRIEDKTVHRISGPVPRGGEWVRLEVMARSLGINSNVSLTGLSLRVMDGEAWFDAAGKTACSLTTVPPPELNPNEVVWFDDDVPANAVLSTSSGSTTGWTWDNTQAASGTRSHVALNRTGLNQHYFSSAAPLGTTDGDVLYTYVLLDPCNPPRQVMLQWNLNNGTDPEHRAYWGDDLINAGSNGTASRYRVGPLPEPGKWVRLEVPAWLVGLHGKNITGATFTIFDGQAWFDRSGRIGRVNVALGKAATQSSTIATDVPAASAVDGNLITINHTNRDPQAWWQVDLGASYPIEHVWLYNRNDGAAVRLSNFWLLVSDDAMPADLNAARAKPDVSAMRYNGFPQNEAGFRINRIGRYVRVQLEGTEFLHLREVQVWAQASASRQNLALGKTTTQSTPVTATQFPASHGVDGLLNYHFNQTDNETRAWWQVDLGKVAPISTVTLFNRFDGFRERLANFYVFVSDNSFPADSTTLLAQPGVKAYYYPSIPLSAEVPLYANGRFVRVQLDGTNILHLSEVQVWSQQPQLTPVARSPESPPER